MIDDPLPGSFMPIAKLFAVYLPLLGWTGLGWILGQLLPESLPRLLGKFLFWVGVPIGIVAFLRHAPISGSLWLAPVTAWAAMLLGLGLAGLSIRQRWSTWSSKTQTSFLLSSMVGNTGYIGFPVSLALVGTDYFVWAVFYDLLGSTPGAYGLGVALAARSPTHAPAAHPLTRWQSLRPMALNPAFWSFGVGLIWREAPLAGWAETGLRSFAWAMVSLSLVLIGMRLSQLSSLKSIQPAAISLGIKMLLVPLLLGSLLWLIGVRGAVHQAILLQMAMPPAFATLVIAEAYDLDREMAVTTIAIGCLGLLLTLPLWLWLF